MKRFLIFTLFILTIFHSSAQAAEKTKTFEQIEQQIDQINYIHGTQASLLVQKLYDLSNVSPDSVTLFTRALYWDAVVNYAQGTGSPNLVPMLEKQLNTGPSLPFSSDKALISYSLSLSYSILGDYGKAFNHALQALEFYKKENNHPFVVKTLVVLGNICGYIKNYQMSEDYYNEAAELVTPSQREFYQVHLNLYKLFFISNHVEKAIDSSLHIIPAVKNFRDTGLIIVAYLNLGACYSSTGQYEKAHAYYDTLSHLTEYVDNKKVEIALYQNIAVYRYLTGSYQLAYSTLSKVDKIARQTNNLEQRSQILNNLSLIFERLGNLDSAYFYLKEYVGISKQLVNNSKAIDAYQAYVSTFLESSENKLTIAEQKIRLKNNSIIIIISISLAAILAAGLLLLYSRQQKRNKESENKDLEERLQQEKEIQQLQDDKMKAQVRELSSYSMLLSSKNNILQQISSLTETLHSDQKELTEIKKIIKSNLNTDSDWKMSMMHFEKVHPDFFHKLKIQCSDLTKNDLRLCAYMQIGIDSKQIAQILNVSHGSVRMHRYRVKKKLGLHEDANLDDFLRTV